MYTAIKYICVISGAVMLAACTGATKLPQPSMTTAELLQNRQAVYSSKQQPYIHGRKVEANPDYRDYTYQAKQQQLDGYFQYLPNPVLTMYVFQHLTPAGAPVPGYPTMFKLYSRDNFALPGELTGNDYEPAEPVLVDKSVKSSDGRVVKSRFGNIGK